MRAKQYRFTLEDVAKIAGLSVRTVRLHHRQGKFDGDRLETVIAYLAQTTTTRRVRDTNA